MPDIRFRWRTLREHLRKYWWAYLLGIALCLAGTDLLFTITEPRPTEAQTVTVYLADSYSNPDALSDIADVMLLEGQTFDPELKLVQFESMMFDDNLYTSRMLMVTRLSVGECDAFLASASAMEALIASEALEPLDEAVASGWPGETALEPYYATVTNEDSGETTTFLAGLRLDDVDALGRRGAFNNEGATLCVAANGGNTQTTMRVLQTMIEVLMEETDAATEGE